MRQTIKNILKKYLQILQVRNRFTASVSITQRQLFHFYAFNKDAANLPKINDAGFRVFSQFEEDGKILYIFSIIGMGTKTFVEIGSDDGINSNCANLYFNFGWWGLFIDGNEKSIKRGVRFYNKYPHPLNYKPKFLCEIVTRNNINSLIENVGIKGEIELLSIDIDGNDYWIWENLEIISPKVVIIETHVEFGYRNIVVPYDESYTFPGKHPIYHGASPVAMVNLARKKGYRLVGANELGFNFIFVKNGIGDKYLKEVSIESVLNHRSVKESFDSFKEIENWEYIVPE